jgi:hypothetical protein
MKKLLLIAVLAIGVSTVSFAQGPPSPEEELAGLKTSLTLIAQKNCFAAKAFFVLT